AKEAVEFYMSLFEDSKMLVVQELEGTPSGENTEAYEFNLAGQPFAALNGGPEIKMNSSISLTVKGETKEEIQTLRDELVEGGHVLMPLRVDACSVFYGWVDDRDGVSWQLIYFDGKRFQQKITPSLLFSGTVTGKARDAIIYYTNVLQNGKIFDVYEYE